MKYVRLIIYLQPFYISACRFPQYSFDHEKSHLVAVLPFLLYMQVRLE